MVAVSDRISSLYQSILGRAADPAGLAADVAAVDAGMPVAEIAVTLALSPEAQYGIDTLYQTEFGRPADPVGLDAGITYLANGGSLAAIRAALAASPEAAIDIRTIYQDVTYRGGGLQVADSSVAVYQNYLAAGGTLTGIRTILANTDLGQMPIIQDYDTILNRAPSSAELAAATSLVDNGRTATPQPPNPSIGYPGSPPANTVASSLVNTSEVIDHINADYLSSTGLAANATDIAAAQSELLSNLPLYLVDSEITQHQEGGNIDAATINPQMIGGSPGSYAYAVLDRDTLISPNPGLIDTVSTGARGVADVLGFDPATDLIGIQATQLHPYYGVDTVTPQFSGFFTPSRELANGVSVSEYRGIAIVVGGDSTIYLEGVNANALTTANFRLLA